MSKTYVHPDGLGLTGSNAFLQGFLRVYALICCTLYVTFPGYGFSSDKPIPSEHAAKVSPYWRVGQQCGINAVYVFLKLYDVETEYWEVTQKLPVVEGGSTLKEMRDVVRKAGLSAKIVRADLGQLPKLLPAIAHVEKDVTSDFAFANRGHFVVVVGVDQDQVTYIDGTTGVLLTIPLAEFARQWTGYLLVRDTSTVGVWMVALTVACLLLTIGSWWRHLRATARPATAIPLPADTQSVSS